MSHLVRVLLFKYLIIWFKVPGRVIYTPELYVKFYSLFTAFLSLFCDHNTNVTHVFIMCHLLGYFFWTTFLLRELRLAQSNCFFPMVVLCCLLWGSKTGIQEFPLYSSTQGVVSYTTTLSQTR